MKIPVIGFGAGSHAKVILEILLEGKQYKPIGFLDSDPNLHGTSIQNIPVLGGDDLAASLKEKGIYHFFIGVGGAEDPTIRIRLFLSAQNLELSPIQVRHPSCIISKSASIEDGAVIMAGVVVNACAQIGSNVILNTNSTIEHDCIIGHHVHIAPGAILSGGVCVGDRSHIGANASIRQNIHIGNNVIIGIGAVVVNDVPDNRVVVGNPAKTIKNRSKK
ncbi:MAG: acetyltransferase [Desulfobacteraceae bacterium]|nr:MAG: acetyltransferase [Desulfobacteraceae bacterium]